MIKNISQFSDDIRMGFGIDKGKKPTIQHGKIAQMENIQLNNGEELKSLELNQQYQYKADHCQNNQISTQKRIF